MNPTLLALSRAYMALPGAPVLLPSDDGWSFRTPAGPAFRRASDGLLWLSDPDQPGTTPLAEERFVLDLTDAATGGVMLDRLGSAAWRVSRRHPAGNAPPWCADLYFSDRPHVAGVSPSVYCATLAEAVARAAVALGRAG